MRTAVWLICTVDGTSEDGVTYFRWGWWNTCYSRVLPVPRLWAFCFGSCEQLRSRLILVKCEYKINWLILCAHGSELNNKFECENHVWRLKLLFVCLKIMFEDKTTNSFRVKTNSRTSNYTKINFKFPESLLMLHFICDMIQLLMIKMSYWECRF